MRRIFGSIISNNGNYKMITSLLGCTLMLIFSFSVIGYVYGQSDFYLEANVVSNASGTNTLKITKLEFHGSADKAICPSGQCRIGSVDQYTLFSPPTPDSMGLAYDIEFKLIDDITNADIGPKKKQFLEQFTASMYGCRINDIIETNAQELYYCEDHVTSIGRTFDSKVWRFNTNATYDAKNSIFKVNSKYIGSVS